MSVTTITEAVHIKLAVTWAGTQVLVAGSGTADIWLKSDLTINGTAVTGTSKTCGLTLPAIQLGSLVNNEKVKLTFDDALWDKPNMPTFMTTGQQGGFSVGSTVSIDPTVGLLGIKASSPYASVSKAWPDPTATTPTKFGTYPQFMASDLDDPDGDGMMGIPVNASNTGGYSYVPTNLNYANDFADIVSFVSRNKIALTGTIDQCDHITGTATVSTFENHVVACHDAASAPDKNCTNITTGVLSGPGFVDTNRTMFAPGSATYVAAKIPAGSNCAAVRTAVP
jgi:hypothetical protein